jgi:uncharacterized protein with von Willebrand factor type A (vWA) domain
MNLRELIRSIRNKFDPSEHLSNDAVLGFLRVLETASDDDVSCSEFYDKLDEYVEREVNGEDAAELMPFVRDHIDLCPECCEEYEALLDVLEKTAEK